MAIIIPDIKREYIYLEATEADKDKQFEQCRTDNKEAAWAGIGTGELDSEYQPSPVKEPDYYMEYCSSDDYDYLKDYRLVWGYGIGIIEQDVICSLITGEHLAEGTEACDTYVTQNADGENIDWKRGIWLKFSGNRNISPGKIGEVILPERIISLKDLCTVLTPKDEVVVEGFNTNNIINMDNMFGKESYFDYRYYIISDFNFDSAKTLNYAFKRVHFVNFPYNINNKNLGGKSLFESAICDNEVTEVNMKLYSRMFYSSGIIINDDFIFNDTDTDITLAFAYSTIDNFPIINFSNATNANNGLFSDIRIINNTTDKTLNLTTYINPERDSTNNHFLSSNNKIILHIISPINEVINYGRALIELSNSTIIFDTIFIYNKFKLYNNFGIYDTNSDNCTIFSIRCQNITCIGTINGTLIGKLNYNNRKTFNDNSNIKIIQDDLNYSDLKKITTDDYIILPFFMLYNNRNNYYNENIKINLNIFDFGDSQIIGNLFYYPNYGRNINTIEGNIDITVNIDKPIIIIGRYFNSITINNTSEDNILIYNKNIVNLAEDLYDYIFNVNTENDIEQYGHCYWINTNNDILSYNNNIIKINKCNTLHFHGSDYLYFENISIYMYDCTKLSIDYDNVNTSFRGNIYLLSNLKLQIESKNHYDNTIINYGNITFLNIEDKNKTVMFPILYNTVNKYYCMYWGKFMDYPLSVLLNSNRVIFSNPYECTYINDVDENNININILGFDNDGINLDLSEFTLNIDSLDNVTSVSYDTNFIGKYMIDDSIVSNLKINNINILNVYRNGADGFRLNNIESNNLNINLNNNDNTFSLLIGDLMNLTKLTISDFNGYITTYLEHKTNIENLLFSNVRLYNTDLKSLDKLTQESINSIVNSSNYRSGYTLIINTIPFQYITDEQKQALVTAGVTLVEYIPTETTE